MWSLVSKLIQSEVEQKQGRSFIHITLKSKVVLFFAGHIEFTWQQIMIGVQSSIIMFPINLLIVSIFRNTRPRERKPKMDASKQGKTVQVSPSQTSSPQKELKYITPNTVMKVTKHIVISNF